MGLSVLIPIYNHDAGPLVEAILQQARGRIEDFEIILWDDASDFPGTTANASLADNHYIHYFRNLQNRGRTITRRCLAEKALYENLIFIDVDSAIPGGHFLENYIDASSKNWPVVSGGRIYADSAPTDCRLMLHWSYGCKRESKANSPGLHAQAFQSNNFLIRKDLFLKLDTGHAWSGYGHEDTWWGMQLGAMGVPVRRIINPVLHTTLEPAEKFLQKAEAALASLLALEKVAGQAELSKEVKLYRWYRRLKALGLMALLAKLEKQWESSITRNLHSCKPSLLLFDFWRLGNLHYLSQK